MGHIKIQWNFFMRIKKLDMAKLFFFFFLENWVYAKEDHCFLLKENSFN